MRKNIWYVIALLALLLAAQVRVAGKRGDKVNYRLKSCAFMWLQDKWRKIK